VIDIIGDVHGQFDKLVALLTNLGYRDSGGAWRHSSRSAIFVGDLIDRGPKQLATVDLVRRMVEAGARMAFVFRDAVKPSVAAASETPVSHAPENKCHPRVAVRYERVNRNCCVGCAISIATGSGNGRSPGGESGPRA
jgi:hypothetical protein